MHPLNADIAMIVAIIWMQILDNMYHVIYIMLQYIMYYMRGMLTMNGEIITQT